MRKYDLNHINPDCCGCGLCERICPYGCIEKVLDDRNNDIYIKGSNCNHCGLCDKYCPLKKDSFYEKAEEFYICKTINNRILLKSSSGGFVHEVAKTIIEKEGIVYGASWVEESQRVEHTRATDNKDIEPFQGSKYVQSFISSHIYSKIQEDLEKGIVLFVGTPCEVAAVRSFSGNHRNLRCIDLICHGVPSPIILSEQLRSISNNPIKEISFRTGPKFQLIVNDGRKDYKYDWEDNPYYVLYMHFASLREYCYHCKYACNRRVGDISVGDYIEGENLYSCVIINSSNGYHMLKDVRKNMVIEKKEVGLLTSNTAYNSPTKKNRYTYCFTTLYKRRGLEFAYRYTFLGFNIKRKIRRIVGDDIYSRIRNTIKGDNP